jgi:predicted MPP superfamily phosphohydrolase
VLSELRAPMGVISVLGNHDRAFDASRVLQALRTAGIEDLEDSSAVRAAPGGPIWIAGVSDLWTSRHDVSRALRAIPDSAAPVLVITHNPDIFPDIPGRVLLTLAGHTHGGQVRLPLLGAPIVPSVFGQRYAAGLVVEGGRHLFVSSGIGTSGLPIRLGVPPTIFLLTLAPASGTRPAKLPARSAAAEPRPRTEPGNPPGTGGWARR